MFNIDTTLPANILSMLEQDKGINLNAEVKPINWEAISQVRGNQQLTVDQVTEIYNKLKENSRNIRAGLPVLGTKELTSLFNISNQTLSRIKKGRHLYQITGLLAYNPMNVIGRQEDYANTYLDFSKLVLELEAKSRLLTKSRENIQHIWTDEQLEAMDKEQFEAKVRAVELEVKEFKALMKETYKTNTTRAKATKRRYHGKLAKLAYHYKATGTSLYRIEEFED